MPRPSTSIKPKKFKVDGTAQKFKVSGSDMNDWLLKNVGLDSTLVEWEYVAKDPKPNFVEIEAKPLNWKTASKGRGHTTGDLTITLTYENPDTGMDEDIVEQCDDIEYEDP